MTAPAALVARVREDLQGCPQAKGCGLGMVHVGTGQRLWLCPDCCARITARGFGYFRTPWTFPTPELDAGRQCIGCGAWAEPEGGSPTMAPRSNGQRAREAALGRFALAVLLVDGPDAGDRLADIVREAVRLDMARTNALAEEATDPWLLTLPPRCGHSACRQSWIDSGSGDCCEGKAQS